MSGDPLLTVPEVALQLRKTERWVRDQAGREKLRGAYYGGAWHFEQADIDAYKAAHANIRPVEKRTRRAS